MAVAEPAIRQLSSIRLVQPYRFRQIFPLAQAGVSLSRSSTIAPGPTEGYRRLRTANRHRSNLVQTRAASRGASDEGLLSGKIVLVTGASRSIGAACAKALAKQKPTLVVSSHEGDLDELNEVIHQCRLNGASVICITADLSRPEGVELLARNSQEHGVVDVVVHAAAVYDALTFEFGKPSGDKGQGPLTGDPNIWDRQASLSYSAPLRLTRRLAPPMAEQGSGWIITIAAEEGTTAWPDAPAFASTKWGLRGWTKSIHPVLKEKGVKVLTINPPGGGKKLNADNVAEELINVLRAAEENPESVPEEVAVR